LNEREPLESKMNTSFKGKTVFITGASRGIGKEIALKLAKSGANIVIASKSTEQNAKLPGTIFSVGEEIEKVGGKALPVATDIRYEDQVNSAVKQTIEKFGGIDIVINNASAIWLKGTQETDPKRFDLMMGINARGTYVVSRATLPYLKKSAEMKRIPHILNISPPLNMSPKWFKGHAAYTMAKYGMSMCVLGMSEEFKDDGIAVNALWPRTGIATAAISMLGGDEMMKICRTPAIMADAAAIILSKLSTKVTGNFFIDDEILLSEGYTMKDLEKYLVVPGTTQLMTDFFLDDITPKRIPKL